MHTNIHTYTLPHKRTYLDKMNLIINIMYYTYYNIN